MRLSRVEGSAVAEHVWGAGHHPDWDGVQCLDQDQHWYTRRIKEAIHIHLQQHNINRDNGLDIPGFWLPTIRQHNRCNTPDGTTGTQRSRAEDMPRRTHGVKRTMPAEVTRPTSAKHGTRDTEDAVQWDITDTAASSSSVA